MKTGCAQHNAGHHQLSEHHEREHLLEILDVPDESLMISYAVLQFLVTIVRTIANAERLVRHVGRVGSPEFRRVADGCDFVLQNSELSGDVHVQHTEQTVETAEADTRVHAAESLRR